MLKELIRFEWRYQTRQPAFAAACAIFLLLGFGLTAGSFGPENVAITSAWLIMESLGLLSLFSVFAIATFVAGAVVRDSEHRMAEIVFTTPVSRFHYLCGRFGGAFAASVTAVAFTPLGMIVATRMPWIDAARVGPLQPLAYLWAFMVMVVPTLLFATALLFAVAVITRSALATYTASVVLYVLYMVCAAMTDSPLMAGSSPGAGGGTLVSLLDPFGLSSFFHVTRYWTSAEKNQRFVLLEGALLVNRLLWIGAALATFAVSYRLFAFRLLRKTKEKKQLRRDTRPTIAVPYARVQPRRADGQSVLAAYRSATAIQISAVMRSKPFLLLLALWFGLAVVEIGGDLFGGEYGSALYPATALIVNTLKTPLSIIGLILIVYYGAELFWREQRYRTASILNATPVRGGVMVLAKWSTLAAMIAATIVVAIIAGIVVQVTHGYWQLEPLLYLSLFYFSGLPLILFAAAAASIHSVSPGKYAGLMFVLLFLIAVRNAPMAGLEHPLWRFAAGPPVGYSAMSGFSDSAAVFSRLMLHWSVLAAALLAMAARSWRRLQDPAAMRIRGVLRLTSRTQRIAAATFVLLFALTGGWIFYETNVRVAYTTSDEMKEWKAAYERRYRALAVQPQPRVTSLITKVDLYPRERRVHVAGTYALVNDTSSSIRTINVAVRRNARLARLELAGATPSARDAAFGMYEFKLPQPLQPGGRTSMTFDLTLEGRAITDGMQSLNDNGSLLVSNFIYPTFGYRHSYELTDPRERKRRNLGRSSTPESDDPDSLGGDTADMQWIELDATISTSADQLAMAPGQLIRQWSEGNRRTFHYRSSAPMLNLFGIATGRYAIARKMEGDVEVTVLHHPAHAMNVPAMLETAVQTLDYCRREFGPYPHRQLKLVEIPSSAFGGFAFPDMIVLSENRAFLIDSRDKERPDLVARRVAHEVAHQWWGHQVVAANRGGSSTLTESLAKYTELMILERQHGRDAVRQLLEYELDRYLTGRAGEEQRERTLANVGPQPYVYYSKGAVVTYALRDLLGEPALNAALSRFVAEKRHLSNATTADLLGHLRAAATAPQKTLIEDWLQKIVLYDLKLESATVTPLPDRTFRIDARVIASRHEASADGSEHEIPLDESIELGVFRVPGIAANDLVDTRRTRLHSGANQISMVVREKPAYVAIDPWLLRIDRNRFDNGKRIP